MKLFPFFFIQVLQVDEIKFDQPVYIDEIRIIPAGHNVNGLEKSLARTGQDTIDDLLIFPFFFVFKEQPMPCELEFFGKNLNARTNRDRVRYRRLGKYEHSNSYRNKNNIFIFLYNIEKFFVMKMT